MKGFKYDKLKSETSTGDSWGSYSDLFMVLSFVFLMMYVVASLRTGTNAIQERLDRQKIARENEDLRAQMKAYETLKDSALKDESQEEQEVYNELMNKLSLLQEEAKDEKTRLRQQAIENEKKEMALNKYQQVVRNIINANMLAKSKLKVREKIIETKNVEIKDLNREVEAKQNEIAENNAQINKINKELARNIANLQKAEASSKITKKKAYEQIARLKAEGQKQIAKLNQENKTVQAQLAQINQELNQTSEQLNQTSQKLEKTETEKNELTQELANTSQQYQEQIKNLQEAHAARVAKEKAAFEKKLKSANLTAKQKAEQLAEFNRQAKANSERLGQQVAALRGELEGAQAREAAQAKQNAELNNKLAKTVEDYSGQIKAMQDAHAAKMAGEKTAFEQKLKAANLSAQQKAAELAEFNRKVKEKNEAVGREIAALKGDLAEAQAKADARAKLAREIAQALKQAGVDANVNANTGDVLISFGQDYFDNDSAKLKPSMAGVLQKFVPRYSESLFKDAKISQKITSVEIVGFASPTYQGKYIDPLSLNPSDKKAAQYNLDLSYKRARAIFDYMFDTQKINYNHQKDLLSLVKVSGRSFFNEGRAPAGITPGMTQKEFCAKIDCKQAQKVIIKFNMDDKK